MPRQELPLIGLLEDSILPGEERGFATPAVDPPTLLALSRLPRGEKPTELFALTITSPVELPSLVTARWGTSCTLVAADGASVTLRGLRRGKLVAARGKESPYKADVDIPTDDPPADDTLPQTLASARALLAALEQGALPETHDWQDKLRAALFDVARAVCPKDALAELAQLPPHEAIERLAKTIAARAQGQAASRDLEGMIRETMNKPELPRALRQRLWSQVVEIQKRLDVFDPSVAEEGDDVARLQRRLSQAGLPKAAREAAKRELRLLRSMQSNHHDYSTYLSHLDFMARLPWQPDPPKPIDLDAVKGALEREHSGLDKAKRRVLEYLAVRKLGGENASMVLCLCGPPGVGKTSIARAMAEALGRPFARIALGGVHDESEIRGHRLSFVAASAGRLLRGIAQAGSMNALVLLDEIDKIGTDRTRSPMAALLEVLDPEQNANFVDNYLGVAYDLSNALFVATANEVSHIHATLLDRMELVEIEGYTANEKSSIAREHLLPRLAVEHGLPATPSITDEALMHVIEGHTRESGVRQLKRTLASIFRARALAIVEGGATEEKATAPIDDDEVRAVLGNSRFSVKTAGEELPAGVATGLSVGPGGGAILFVEAGLMPGKGQLGLTGRLGEVLQESARAALAHLRSQAARYGIDQEKLAAHDVHLHLPEAATEKDGPSAGTAIFVALVSVLSGTPVPSDLALTGEISLTGRVLPVGGVRAKLLAAERAGVRKVLLPADNMADVPPDVALEVVAVRSLDEVFRAAFPQGTRPAAGG